MSFTATPTDVNGTPMSSAVPDGTNTPLAVEGGPSKSTGGNTLVPVATYQYDGYQVTFGAQADGAASSDTATASFMSLFKRALQKLTSIVTNTGNIPAAGQNTMVNSLPVVLASDQTNVSMNLKQVSNAAISASNPVITQQQLAAAVVAGQAFSATTGKQTSSGSGNGLACLFSPVSATKNILIYSIEVYCVTAGSTQFSYVTSDPALGTSITPLNANLASATTSIATAEYTATVGSVGGTTAGVVAAGNNTVVDLLGAGGNPSYIYLPSGQAGIHGVEVGVATSTNAFAITFKWLEF